MSEDVNEQRTTLEEFRTENFWKVDWCDVKPNTTYEIIILNWRNVKIIKHSNYMYLEFVCQAFKDIPMLGIRQDQGFILQISSNSFGYKLDRFIQFLNADDKEIYLRFTRRGQNRVSIDECKLLEDKLKQKEN